MHEGFPIVDSQVTWVFGWGSGANEAVLLIPTTHPEEPGHLAK